MEIISKVHPLFLSILGQQSVNEDLTYRPFFYVKRFEINDDIVLINLLTIEAVVLKGKEKEAFTKLDKNNPVFNELVNKWFLVPEEFDDITFCQQYETVVDTIRNRSNSNNIYSFTIFPTTDCNARCFYCYELGCTKKTMTDKTALDVADFIVRKSHGEKVSLRWFGGEPLYNKKAINIICSELKAKGVDFESEMTSNGFLFDAETVEEAANLWNLKSVQITFDGTEDVYNRIKAYIYKDCKSPFQIVLRNVEDLLQHRIRVKTRMNLDKHNFEDLFKLADFLLEKFSKYPHFCLYSHPLFDNDTDLLKNRSLEQRRSMENKAKQLDEKITSVKPNYARPIIIKRDTFRCMADNDKAVMILPDGKLGKCEHYIDEHSIGSIYSDKRDEDEVRWYKRLVVPFEKCNKCIYRPACRTLAVCPSLKKHCDDVEVKAMDDKYERIAQRLYEKEIKTEENGENLSDC